MLPVDWGQVAGSVNSREFFQSEAEERASLACEGNPLYRGLGGPLGLQDDSCVFSVGWGSRGLRLLSSKAWSPVLV